MERTFHPVGHGAFYTERFTLPDRTYNIVYDCGCFEAAKKGMNRKQYCERIYSIIDSCFKENDVIDALFISHFHTDHILGVAHLSERCDIKRIVLPQLSQAEILAILLEEICDYNDNYPIDEMAESWQAIYSDKVERIEVLKDDLNDVDVREINLETIKDSVASGSRLRFLDKWVYIPFNSPISQEKVNDLYDAVNRECNEIFNGDKICFDELRKYLESDVNREKLKSAYIAVFKKEKMNETSMILYSGMLGCNQKCERHCGKALHYANRYCTLNCLYLGDFEAKKQNYFDGLMEVYKPYFKHIGIIQVPHHGSNNNYNANLYSSSSPDKSSILHRICLVSADSNDEYGHPDEDVLDGIQKEGGIPILVTEFPKTKQVFRFCSV